jgi:hypothetical protein
LSFEKTKRKSVKKKKEEEERKWSIEHILKTKKIDLVVQWVLLIIKRSAIELF